MEVTTTNKSKTKFYLSLIAMIIFVGVIIYLTIDLWPYFTSLATPEGQTNFRTWVNEFGLWGFILVLGIQIVQVVVAFIPGQVTELLSGMLYGVPGVFVSLGGAAIASFIIFGLVKLFGKPIVDFFVSDKDKKRYEFLNNAKRLEAFLLFIYLLPGIPKDAVTYLAATTKVKAGRFVLISTIGRFPATLLSAIIGYKFGMGDFKGTFYITLATAVVFVVLVIFSKPIIRFFETKLIK